MEFVPKKLYYKIREVCEIVKVEAHVLRFWETEFPSLTPPKSKSGQRTYRPKDIELLLRIRKLLYEEGYTIAGARKQLHARETAGSAKPVLTLVNTEKPPLESSSELLSDEGGVASKATPVADACMDAAREKLYAGDSGNIPKIVAEKEKPVDLNLNPEEAKPSSARLKRVQAELENILTLLDRE
jgi:DNA-binding transcriptional MerR regulator